MRVLFLNQFFHPDLAATAQLATDLAEDLVAAGHEVTALAARGAYLGGQALPARERHQGVDIQRVASTSLGKATILRRLVGYGVFYLAALGRVLTLPRSDVVVAMSTPPLVATIGALLRRLRGGRFVYWVQDVYPDLAVAFGVLRAGSLTTRTFDLISGATLRRADAVVVLGEAMADRLAAKGVPRSRLHVIPNWADGAAVRPVPPERNAFRAAHGLAGKQVVLYSGNMGPAHDLETLLDAARLLRHRSDLVFVFIGDGARRRLVEAAVAELPSVRLLPYQARERLSESLSAGDLHAVTQKAETLGLIEPSKLYGVLAVGRPVLYIGPAGSEVARTVRAEGVGEVVANGDAAGAAAAIERLLVAGAPAGLAARAALDRTYGRTSRTLAFEALLRSLEGSRQG